MQFKDAKKEGSVEFVRIRNKGIGSTSVFEFTLTKPVQASGYFGLSNLRTIKGKIGLLFYHPSEFSKAYGVKQDVFIVIPSEVKDFIENTNAEKIDEIKEEAKIDPETWRWHEGCDTGRMYLTPNRELMDEFRSDLAKVSEVLEKEYYSAPKEFHTGVKDEQDNVIVSHEVVINLYNAIIEKRNAKKADKQAKKDVIFQKAKDTGEKQILETYSVECSDPDEECDVDIVTVYAMPDGTTTRTQNHTW